MSYICDNCGREVVNKKRHDKMCARVDWVMVSQMLCDGFTKEETASIAGCSPTSIIKFYREVWEKVDGNLDKRKASSKSLMCSCILCFAEIATKRFNHHVSYCSPKMWQYVLNNWRTKSIHSMAKSIGKKDQDVKRFVMMHPDIGEEMYALSSNYDIPEDSQHCKVCTMLIFDDMSKAPLILQNIKHKSYDGVCYYCHTNDFDRKQMERLAKEESYHSGIGNFRQTIEPMGNL